MKTKEQKKEQLEKGKELFAKSKFLVFADFGALSAEQMRKLRRELEGAASELHVIKKRLLSLMFKGNEGGPDLSAHKVPVGTVFSRAPGLEEASGALHRFFKELKLEKEKILGGYDVAARRAVSAEEVMFLGALPSREVLLGQLVGMLSAPIRSFMIVLTEKAKKSNQ